MSVPGVNPNRIAWLISTVPVYKVEVAIQSQLLCCAENPLAIGLSPLNREGVLTVISNTVQVDGEVIQK